MDNLAQFLRRARELGALEAKIIEAGSIITAAWVRLRCQFGCDGYGRSRCCPPHTPTPQQMQEVINGYRRALLIHCQELTQPTKIATALEREVFLAGFYKAFALGAGSCKLCKRCDLEECNHPEEARPAMEACGIDVYATARGNGYPIEVVKDHSCPQNYYGLVLID